MRTPICSPNGFARLRGSLPGPRPGISSAVVLTFVLSKVSLPWTPFANGSIYQQRHPQPKQVCCGTSGELVSNTTPNPGGIRRDRKGVVEGQRGYDRVDPGG